MSPLLRRVQRTRTTWPFRLGLLACVGLTLWLTSAWWSPAIARSLACDQDLTPTDALLLENFDPDYLVFERARALRQAGVAQRVLVPTNTDDNGALNDVSLGIAQVMSRISRLDNVEPVPIPQVEPISLNAGYRIREFLEREHIRSITVVAPHSRSRRSSLVYHATLGPAGITVRCVPVPGARAPGAWMESWHGIQNVVEQWAKLQYYRFWVLPFVEARSM